MNDRDTFAAAALAGLLAQGDDGSFSEESYARAAYRWADTMLRERANSLAGVAGMDPTAHPAPPCVETDGFSPDSRTGQINRTPECESPRRECGESSLRDVSRPGTKGKAAGGPEHHISDRPFDSAPVTGPVFAGSPVSYAENDEKRVNWPTNRGTTQPRSGAVAGVEPVAWGLPDATGKWLWGVSLNREAIQRHCPTNQSLVPLYRHHSPTLTGGGGVVCGSAKAAKQL